LTNPYRQVIMQMLEKQEEKPKYSWLIIRYKTTLIFKTKNEMKTSKQQFIHQRKNVTMSKIKPRMKQRVFKNEEIPIRKIKKDFAKFNLQPKAKNGLSAT
jgi:hypothetical protein